MQIFITIFILSIAALYLTYIIHAVRYTESEVIKEAGFMPILLTFIIAIGFIFTIWFCEVTKITNQPIIPTIKVENIIVNDSIVKSDTTYTYTFKK